MERLSGLDSTFLYLETPTHPFHICAVVVLDVADPAERHPVLSNLIVSNELVEAAADAGR